MLKQNFGVTNKQYYGMLRYFWSVQLQALLLFPALPPERPGELDSRLFNPRAGRIKKTSYTLNNEKHYKKVDCLVLLIAEISYRV